jgi:uncharacterized membrane protein
MAFIKYIFELIVVVYIIRFVMQWIDNTFGRKPIQKSASQTQFTKPTTQPKSNTNSDDYIEFEEIK